MLSLWMMAWNESVKRVKRKKNSMDEIDFEAFLNLRHKRNITDKFTF